MSEVIGVVILGIIGFLIGGAVGAGFYEGFFPYCWFGLAIAWGIPVCACCLD